VQLGAMQRNVRSAKAPLDCVPHGMQVRDLGAVPCAVVPDLGCEPEGTNALLEPEAAHHLHRIRVELDACTHAGEGGSLLVDLRSEPELAQGGGSSESRDAGAYYGYCRRVPRHNALPITSRDQMVASRRMPLPLPRMLAPTSVDFHADRAGNTGVNGDFIVHELVECWGIERQRIDAQSRQSLLH